MSSKLENANMSVDIKKRKNIFKSRKFWVIGIIAIAVILFIASSVLSKPSGKAVGVADASKKDIVLSITVTGNIKPNQEDKSLLSVSQKVMDIFVKEGQDVKKGTPLVKLDTSDLDYQLKKTTLSLNSAKSNYENGRKSASDAVTQAQINLGKAQSDYDRAKAKLDGDQVLYDGGYISKDEYDTSNTALTNAENQLKLMQMQFDNSNTTLNDYDRASQQKQQIDQYKADIENYNKKIADSTINAGIDGRVVTLDVAAGEYPKSDKNTILISDLSVLKLNVAISQYDAVKVQVGQKASLKVKGVDKLYAGTVTKVGQIANVAMSGTNQESKVDIEITVDNPDGFIKPGYEADADITLNERKGVMNVNFEAVMQDAKGKYVFVVENGKAVRRDVKTGLETDFEIEITYGLKEGEIYVTNPGTTLKDGDMIITPASTADTTAVGAIDGILGSRG